MASTLVHLVPRNLAHPPHQWSAGEVKAWLNFCVEEFALSPVCASRFDMNGKAMCLLTRTDFIERAPHAGDVLHNVFQRLRQHDAPSTPAAVNVRQPFVPILPQPPRQATTGSRSSDTLDICDTSVGSTGKNSSSSNGGKGNTVNYSNSNNSGSNSNNQDNSLAVSTTSEENSLCVPTSILSPAPSERSPSHSDCSSQNDHLTTSQESMDVDPDPKLDHVIRQSTAFEDEIPSSEGGCRLLWEFIHLLLEDPRHADLVCWESQAELTFRINDQAGLAALWGQQKNKLNMTYEKLSRALRYYYKMNIIKKVPGRRLTYRFLQHPTKICKGQRGARPHSSRVTTDVLPNVTDVATCTTGNDVVTSPNMAGTEASPSCSPAHAALSDGVEKDVGGPKPLESEESVAATSASQSGEPTTLTGAAVPASVPPPLSAQHVSSSSLPSSSSSSLSSSSASSSSSSTSSSSASPSFPTPSSSSSRSSSSLSSSSSSSSSSSPSLTSAATTSHSPPTQSLAGTSPPPACPPTSARDVKEEESASLEPQPDPTSGKAEPDPDPELATQPIEEDAKLEDTSQDRESKRWTPLGEDLEGAFGPSNDEAPTASEAPLKVRAEQELDHHYRYQNSRPHRRQEQHHNQQHHHHHPHQPQQHECLSMADEEPGATSSEDNLVEMSLSQQALPRFLDYEEHVLASEDMLSRDGAFRNWPENGRTSPVVDPDRRTSEQQSQFSWQQQPSGGQANIRASPKVYRELKACPEALLSSRLSSPTEMSAPYQCLTYLERSRDRSPHRAALPGVLRDAKGLIVETTNPVSYHHLHQGSSLSPLGYQHIARLSNSPTFLAKGKLSRGVSPTHHPSVSASLSPRGSHQRACVSPHLVRSWVEAAGLDDGCNSYPAHQNNQRHLVSPPPASHLFHSHHPAHQGSSLPRPTSQPDHKSMRDLRHRGVTEPTRPFYSNTNSPRVPNELSSFRPFPRELHAVSDDYLRSDDAPHNLVLSRALKIENSWSEQEQEQPEDLSMKRNTSIANPS